MDHSNCPEQNLKLLDHEETEKHDLYSRDKIINVTDPETVQVLELIGEDLKQLL